MIMHSFFNFCGAVILSFIANSLSDQEIREIDLSIATGDIARIDTILARKPWLLNVHIGDTGNSLLAKAVNKEVPNMAEHLRKRGAKVDIRSAVLMGWDEDVRAIVKKDPKSLKGARNQFPPIIDAIHQRRLSTVKLLLDLGSSLRYDGPTIWHSDALCHAVERNDAEIVRLILDRIDESHWRVIARTALGEACKPPYSQRDNALVLKMLLDKKPPVTDEPSALGPYLIGTAKHGNVPAVRLLLQAGADPDGRGSPANPERLTSRVVSMFGAALQLARALNPMPTPEDPPGYKPPRDEGVVRVTVQMFMSRLSPLIPFFVGASVLTDDEMGRMPPIHMIAVSREIKDERIRTEIADLLIQAGARWTFPAAVAFRKTKIVLAMLTADPRLTHAVMYSKLSPSGGDFLGDGMVYDTRPLDKEESIYPCYPLPFAAQRGFTDIVRLLLAFDQPQDPTTVTPLAVSALLAAVEGGHLDTVQAILASKKHKDDIKKGVGDVFAKAGRCANVAFLEALDAVRTPTKQEASAALREAAAAGHLKVAQRASTLGGDPGAADQFGFTALYKAAEHGYPEIVRWLLEERVDPNKTCKSGYGPLHIAAGKGHVLCVRALMGAKADPNLVASDGGTPLMMARSNVIGILVGGGADLKLINSVGSTAIHIAAASGSVESVEELLRLGADPNVKNANGDTPLTLVAKRLKLREEGMYEKLSKVKELLASATRKK